MSLKQPQSILLLDNYRRHLSDSEKELETGQRLSDGFGTCDLTCTRSLFDVIIKIPLQMATKSNTKSGYIGGGQYTHTETNTEKKAKAIQFSKHRKTRIVT